MKFLVGAVTCLLSICTLRSRCELFSDINGAMLNDNYGPARTEIIARRTRSLTFPNPSLFLLIFGLGTPLQLDRESVIVGLFLKYLFVLPPNATSFTEPGVLYARTKKTRWAIYKAMQRLAQLYGLGGRSCVLRAICDAAFAPFDIDHGLFGQLAQAILSPSSTNETLDEYDDQEYHAAELSGKTDGRNCRSLYPECEQSILDVFSFAHP